MKISIERVIIEDSMEDLPPEKYSIQMVTIAKLLRKPYLLKIKNIKIHGKLDVIQKQTLLALSEEVWSHNAIPITTSGLAQEIITLQLLNAEWRCTHKCGVQCLMCGELKTKYEFTIYFTFTTNTIHSIYVNFITYCCEPRLQIGEFDRSPVFGTKDVNNLNKNVTYY